MRAAPEDLKNHFRTVSRRKVAKDRTITLNGKLYEAPVALIGKQVELITTRIRAMWKSDGIKKPMARSEKLIFT